MDALVDQAVGPFCPANVYSDVATRTLCTETSHVGMWFRRGLSYALTGQFIANLATFHSNGAWQMLDPSTGVVKVTNTQALFEAVAQPSVPAALAKHCVEGKLSHVGGGIARSIQIPVTPVPTHRILAGHTIAAFDPNGGHINSRTGDHFHADTVKSHQVAGTVGHTDSTRGDHHHAASAGEDRFIGCFKGQQGSSNGWLGDVSGRLQRVRRCGAVQAHEGSFGSEVMWAAREGRKVDGACSFQNHEHDVYRGSCQSVKNALVCFRNRPIERAQSLTHVHRHDAEPTPKLRLSRGCLWHFGFAVLLVRGGVVFGLGKKAAA